MPREAAVEHRPVESVVGGVVRPGLGIAEVAPGVVAQPLLHRALGVRYRGPRAEVVLEDVVGLVHSVAALHHGEHAVGSRDEGAPA